MTLKEFSIRIKAFEKLMPKVHTISPMHPLKKYASQLLAPIRLLPDDVVVNYMNMMEAQDRINKQNLSRRSA